MTVIIIKIKSDSCFTLQIEECVVCSDKKASVLFMPCAHMCACDGKYIENLTFIAVNNHILFNSDSKTFKFQAWQRNLKV